MLVIYLPERLCGSARFMSVWCRRLEKPLAVNFNDYLLAPGCEVTVGSNKLHYYSATLTQAILLNIHHVSGHIMHCRQYIIEEHALQVFRTVMECT